MIKSKNGRLALLSKCVVCGNKKSRFIKEMSNLGIEMPLNKIPLLKILL